MGFGKAQKKLRNKQITNAKQNKNIDAINNLDDNRVYISKEFGLITGKQMKDYQKSYIQSNK